MQSINATSKVQSQIENYFQNQSKTVKERLSLSIMSAVCSGKFNTHDIISKMCEINGNNFDGNESKLTRFLDSEHFQIDEQMCRNYINFLFDSLVENGLENGTLLQINVDITTVNDDFLIIYANIIFKDISYPLYFSLRLYSKRKNQYNHKKFEEAFMNMLRQLLSSKYKYIIVADRGFGNNRFLELCTKNDFQFCIRLKENLNIIIDEKTQNLREFSGDDVEFSAVVKKWKKQLKFAIVTENNKTWFLMHNILQNPQNTYENRFKIETMFKNFKSGCFDIEKTKIKKYHRMKKMLFIYMFAYSIYLFVGNFIVHTSHPLKKKFKNHLNLFILFLL